MYMADDTWIGHKNSIKTEAKTTIGRLCKYHKKATKNIWNEICLLQEMWCYFVDWLKHGEFPNVLENVRPRVVCFCI